MNGDLTVGELRNWKIFKGVKKDFLAQIRNFMVVPRCYNNWPGYALVITQDDQVYIMEEQSGRGEDTEYSKYAIRIDEFSGIGIIGFSASWRFVSAWTDDGKLFMMGANDEGQLGQRHINQEESPQQVLEEMDVKVLRAACGGGHTICVTKDGEAYAWGANTYRQCSHTSINLVFAPRKIKFSLSSTKVVDVACTVNSSFALTTDGELYGWGSNEDGEVGIGMKKKIINVPTKIMIPDGQRVANISCGYKHCIVQSTKGTLFAWGCNGFGQLGTGNKVSERSPVKIGITNVISISANSRMSSSVCETSDGRIFAWGRFVNSTVPKCTAFETIHDCCAHYDIGTCESRKSKISSDVNTIGSEGIPRLVDHENLKTISFQVDDQRITAYEMYLKRCTLFRKMLKSEWQKELEAFGVVKITGWKGKHFQIFINYLHTGRIGTVADEDLKNLLKLAHFYKMEEFRSAITDVISKALTDDNVADFYFAAQAYNDEIITINYITPRVSEFLNKLSLPPTSDGITVEEFFKQIQARGSFKVE